MHRRELIQSVIDARERTLALVTDLSDEQLLGPRLKIVNPLLWEIGHVAWFQEWWVLRHALGRPAMRADGDRLYDSSNVPHDTRWDLPLPSRAETLRYLEQTRDQVTELLGRSDFPHQADYFVRLTIAHEDMHDEAFVLTRQTLGYPRPMLGPRPAAVPQAGPLRGDVQIPGGTFLLGAFPGHEPFIHDNEKWAHPIEINRFSIAKAAVTQQEFADFVDAGGYRRREFWSEEGNRWRDSADAKHPAYWRPSGREWLRRDFDQWVPLEPHRPIAHVNWYEAEAYCRFANRRLPTEAEWELAAAGPCDGAAAQSRKARYPWGNEPPARGLANLDGWVQQPVEVSDLGAGDSPYGCRQMIGNVWEWTSSPFLPYPGFSADPYRDYSVPWFETHKVLRGGCWFTRARLIRNTWRNFYTPDRRDIIAGLRTCAL